jgi:two-component system, OmpR family, response regulator
MEPTPPRDHRMTVLVVEDYPDTAETLAILLRIDGHEVQVVRDGRAALEFAAQSPPDVVLLDIGLPGGLDGWQLAERLARASDGKRPLLIALTGYGQNEDRQRSERAGIDLHLLKPADPKQLLAVLRRFRSILRPPMRGAERRSRPGAAPGPKGERLSDVADAARARQIRDHARSCRPRVEALRDQAWRSREYARAALALTRQHLRSSRAYCDALRRRLQQVRRTPSESIG